MTSAEVGAVRDLQAARLADHSLAGRVLAARSGFRRPLQPTWTGPTSTTRMRTGSTP